MCSTKAETPPKFWNFENIQDIPVFRAKTVVTVFGKIVTSIDDVFVIDPDVIIDIYLDDEGLGTVEVPGDPSDIQLMMDSMATSSDNFFQELGVQDDDDGKGGGWKYDDDNLCSVVLVKKVDKRNLDKAKQLCELSIEEVKRIPGILHNPTMNDCVEVFLHRDWYFLIENLINSKLPTNENKCTILRCSRYKEFGCFK